VNQNRIIWVAPGAWGLLTSARAAHIAAAGLAVVPAPDPAEAIGPAVLLLAPSDLSGARREPHRKLAKAATPGNPVLLGGTDDRDTLLDAVNIWGVWRVVPRDATPEELTDGLVAAAEVQRTRTALHQGAESLFIETRRIEDAITRLEGARGRLLDAERETAASRVSDGLLRCVEHHMQSFESFEGAIAGMPRDPVLERQARFAFDGLRALTALLGDLRGNLDADIGGTDLREPVDRTVENVLMYCRFDKRTSWRRLEATLGCQAAVAVDRHRLFHAVSSLLRHALEHSEANAGIILETSSTANQAMITIRHTDTPADTQTRQLVASDAAAPPLSPGLRVCLAVVARHGGQVAVNKTSDNATLHRITLPALPAPRSEPAK
jgi:hypothetical protein